MCQIKYDLYSNSVNIKLLNDFYNPKKYFPTKNNI